MPTPLPYEQRGGESSKAYEAFAIYRDMGVNRSTDSVARQLSKSSALIQRWSREYDWVIRVTAWDAHIDAQARKQVERDSIKRKADMLKRHALTGKVMQQKGVEYLDKHGIDKSSDAVTSIKAGIEIERKSEGLPEYLVAMMDAPDDELARQYNALLAEIGLAGSGNEAPGDTDPRPDTTATPTTEDG